LAVTMGTLYEQTHGGLNDRTEKPLLRF